MKYSVTYAIKVSKRKEIVQTAYCLGQDSLLELLGTITKLGYTLKSVESEEK